MARRWSATVISACVCALIVAATVHAGNRKKPKRDKQDVAPQIDPKAEEVLRRLADQLAQAKNFSVKATMDWRFQMQYGSTHKGSKYKIAFERGRRFAMIQKGGDIGDTIVDDGERVFAHSKERQAYALTPSSGGMKQVGEFLATAAFETNMPGMSLVYCLIQDDPYAALLAGVTKAEHAGTDRYNGKTCDHIKLYKQIGKHESTWELWVKSGSRPSIARFQTLMSEDDMRVGSTTWTMPGGGEGIARVAFAKWKFDGKLKDKQFAYKQPKKAQEVENALAILFARPPHPMLGKKAPKIKLDLLGGGKLDLKSHLGKDIVVLDFWATWCGPCEMAFPTLIEVTDDFADRGVVFYAVNEREYTDEIKEYLKEKKFDLTVALDRKGGTGGKYRADGLPQTVIIDKHGVIQSVHQGYSTELKARLTKELKTLLKGEALVKKKT